MNSWVTPKGDVEETKLYTTQRCSEQLNVPIQRLLLAIACVLFVLAAKGVFAATDVASASQYSVKVWANDEGLPQNSVLSLAQTRDGYLWVGTFKGLVRFDGIEFKNLTPELTDRIVYLFEDSRRTLWIGTENTGTKVLNGGRLIALPELAAGGFERRLRAACEDAEGAVWLYYENGDLWRCAPGHPPKAFVAPREEGTRTMIRETNGPVWVGTRRHQLSVGQLADNGSFELPVVQDISFSRLDALVSSARGGYWRLANGQVQRVGSDREQNIVGYPWLPYDVDVSSACEDRDGSLVVGTKGAGVFVISPEGRVSCISTNSDLFAGKVLSVLADREGTLWVGTDGGGLNRVKRNTFQLLESTRNWPVQSVAQDGAGSLWIGSSYNYGLGYWTNGTMQRLANPFPIQSAFVDREQSVWLGAASVDPGLLQLRDQGFQTINPGGAIQSKVQAIFQDRAGVLWFGTENGLVRSANGEWKLFSGQSGLTSTNVAAIADDASGNIWIGTQRGGINRLRDGKWTALRKSDGAPSDDIAGLIVDDGNVLWVTTPVGLGRFENNRWTRYTTNTGLVSENLGYILDDREGNLWIGSVLGVLRLSKSTLNDFARGATKSILCRAYGKPDGLPTRECTFGSQPGAWLGMKRTLWFPTGKGLAELKLAQFRPNTNPPPVVIAGVVVDDLARKESIDSNGSKIVLNPRDDRLSIQYASLNLGAPERARFRYLLEGYDKNWREVNGETRMASYSRLSPWLSPAHYTFHVTAANEDGVWNQTGVSLAIVVQPPVTKTWWFLAIAALIVAGLIASVARYLSTQKLQRQVATLRQQEALEKERARIARDIHDQVGASLTQVALLGELVETDRNSPEEVQSHAQQISQTARETTRALDEIVWTVNPQNDTLEGLVNYICKYAQDYLAVAGLRYRFDVPAQLPAHPIPPDVRHNAFLASKEAVTNVVRHAKATAAWVRLKLEPHSFTLEIEDNGRGVAGLDLNAPQTRNGLKNMRKRMEDVGGAFSIGPGSEGGALVRLNVPLQTRNSKPGTN